MAGNTDREAENRRTGELHQIVKTLKIWKEHFDAVLNKVPPER